MQARPVRSFRLLAGAALALTTIAASPSFAEVVCATLIPGGSVAGATWNLAGSPYCVTGNLVVSLLTIQPGVRVYVDGVTCSQWAVASH